MRVKAGFDEAAHPRDETGKFAEGGGGEAVAGTVNEAYFSGRGPGGRIFALDVHAEVRSAVIGELVRTGTPASHLEGFNKITTRHDPSVYKENGVTGMLESRSQGNEVYAYEDVNAGTMVLSPAAAKDLEEGSPAATHALFHELAHNVEYKAQGALRTKDFSARMRVIYDKLVKDKGTKWLGEHGLRPYSKRDAHELWADMYAGWVTKPALRPKFREVARRGGIDMDMVMEGYR
jgi:hypothetical protein